MRLIRRTVLVLLTLLALTISAAAVTPSYYMMLGSRAVGFDHPPVIEDGDTVYITLAVLEELELPVQQGQPAALPVATVHDSVPAFNAEQRTIAAVQNLPHEHYNPVEEIPGRPADYESGEAGGAVYPQAPVEPGSLQPGFTRYRLGNQFLDLNAGSGVLRAVLNGTELTAPDITVYEGHGYISSARSDELGLKLSYNPSESLFQLVGLVHNITVGGNGDGGVEMNCLTPFSLRGEQVDDERVTIELSGGFFDGQPAGEVGSASISRVGFKSQPELGRSFMFIRQPQRTGFKLEADERVGYGKVRLGNFLQLASYSLTSSGEISVNVQLGAGAELRHEIIANPPRLVVDFEGVQYREPTQRIEVGQGHVERIRIGQPQPGTVRLVLDLTDYLDYRVLSKDNGAQHFIQLLPYAPAIATAQQRRTGRTIMLDAGHGGSDQGAPGVISGISEAPLALSMTLMVAGELERMGYDVLLTRRDDRFVSLGERGDFANSALPYIFVSIHCNSFTDPEFDGLMVFHWAGSPEGSRLAELIQESAAATSGATNRGTRDWGNFFVLRETVMPSVLVETGFLSNERECRLLSQRGYQLKMAQGIAQGIDRYVAGY